MVLVKEQNKFLILIENENLGIFCPVVIVPVKEARSSIIYFCHILNKLANTPFVYI